MKNQNKKKLIVTSALVAGMAVGGAGLAHHQLVNATDGENDQSASKSELSEGSEKTSSQPELSEGSEQASSQPELSEGSKQTSSQTELSEDGKQTSSGRGKRPELSEEKKAEIREKLANMTEEEREAWLKNHKDGHAKDHARGEKPANMSDEEWEAKKAERKAKLEEKLSQMTDEEKQAWLESHKPKDAPTNT